MKTKTLSCLLAFFVACFLFIAHCHLYAQVVTVTDDDAYTPDNSAMLDVKSIDKGLLIPRLDSLQRVGISSPATGLLVFDTDANAFFYYDGTDWLNLTTNVISPSSAGMNDALFSVINTNGDTVFAVYPEAVNINVGDGEGKAKKGGFAVGGLASGKLPQKQFLVVSQDSVRIYIDTTTGTKAKKGGFAVGGLASGKSSGPTFFTVSDDSVRIYLDTTGSSKAKKGGFAVGGLASGKAIASNYLTVSPDSVRVFIDTTGVTKAKKGGFAVGGLASGKSLTDDYFKVNGFTTNLVSYAKTTDQVYADWKVYFDDLEKTIIPYNLIYSGDDSVHIGIFSDNIESWYPKFIISAMTRYQSKEIASGPLVQIDMDNIVLGWYAGASLCPVNSYYNVFLGTDAGVQITAIMEMSLLALYPDMAIMMEIAMYL